MAKREFLNSIEASEALGISRRTVYDLIRSERLEAEKFGRDWLISRASVEAEAERRAKKKGKNEKQ